ncbi:MAG: GNAT family N-acetyltransferase [Helicobacteraceae bacterium]|nr:GNAT family N-acetyltransferase [Helicobacteraceae bacterium]
MLIRWLNETDLNAVARWGENEGWFVDTSELEKIRTRFFYLSFGAFDGDFLLGAIMGYAHEKTAWLCNFIVDKELRKKGIGARLFDRAFEAIVAEKPTQKLFAEPNMAAFYERYGFKEEGVCGRFVLRGGSKAPSLGAERLRKLETKNVGDLLKYGSIAFGEERSAFVKEDMLFANSLILASQNAVMHSRVIGKNVFAGPFLVREAAYSDAEFLIRGAIAIRGLKSIAIDLPMENVEAARIFKMYGFEQKGETIRMFRGDRLREKSDMIYCYATAGSHG